MKAFARDTRGGPVVEFALTLPLFLVLLLGVVQAALILWAQLGIQHGAAMAARCASVDTTQCGSADDVQAFAAAQAYGLSIPATAFSFSAAACGNQVSANYSYSLIGGQIIATAFGTGAIALKARSCFPK